MPPVNGRATYDHNKEYFRQDQGHPVAPYHLMAYVDGFCDTQNNHYQYDGGGNDHTIEDSTSGSGSDAPWKPIHILKIKKKKQGSEQLRQWAANGIDGGSPDPVW